MFQVFYFNKRRTQVMRKLKLCNVVLFFWVACIKVNAQEPQIPNFGKDLIQHLNMTSCEVDSSAHAVVLFDNGESSIKYDKDKGYFYVEIYRHTRIKILDKDGLEWADIIIPLYKSKTSKEKLDKIKGATYNLTNGKIESTKLSLKSLFFEDISDRLTLAKFTMPQVKEGSVIEFSYTVISEFTYNLQPWEFQTDIPTLISKYTVIIPEYYKYNHRISGYENITVEKKNRKETIFYKDDQSRSQMNIQPHMVTINNIQYDTEWYIFYGYNIPKIENEPYVDYLKNYQTRIDFELQYIQFPNQMKKQYALNWDSATNELLESDNFGKEIDGARFLTDDIQAISNKITDKNDKILAIFSYIQEKIKWNDRYRLRTEKGIKKAYVEGSGNSAEVNLCLIAALKQAGFDAFPIALSTRSSGMIHKWEVSLSKLNHVIAGVVMDDGIITLDATESFSAPNILPLECLNGNARIIDKKRADWVDLNPSFSSKSDSYVKMTISENGDVYGSVAQDLYDYSALRLHNTLIGDDNFTKYQELLTKRLNNGIIDSINVNQSILPRPIINVKYYASIPESAINAGGLIYLSPGLGFLLSSNPFVSTTRKLPINFHFPFVENYVFSYAIPDGYSIQEVPKNTSFKMLDGKGDYNYSIEVKNEEVIITVSLAINQTLFVPSEYGEIKDFFDKLVSKNAEKLIFKKI